VRVFSIATSAAVVLTCSQFGDSSADERRCGIARGRLVVETGVDCASPKLEIEWCHRLGDDPHFGQGYECVANGADLYVVLLPHDVELVGSARSSRRHAELSDLESELCGKGVASVEADSGCTGSHGDASVDEP
jgi:hypothetical protein